MRTQVDTRTESDDFISICCVIWMQGGWKELQGLVVFVVFVFFTVYPGNSTLKTAQQKLSRAYCLRAGLEETAA